MIYLDLHWKDMKNSNKINIDLYIKQKRSNNIEKI